MQPNPASRKRNLFRKETGPNLRLQHGDRALCHVVAKDRYSTYRSSTAIQEPREPARPTSVYKDAVGGENLAHSLRQLCAIYCCSESNCIQMSRQSNSQTQHGAGEVRCKISDRWHILTRTCNSEYPRRIAPSSPRTTSQNPQSSRRHFASCTQVLR